MSANSNSRWLEYFPSGSDEPPPSTESVKRAEEVLGFRLPTAYVALLRERNGGMLKDRYIYVDPPNFYGVDHFCLFEILGIGGRNSIDSVYAPPYSDSLLAIPLGKRVKGSLGYPGSGFVFSFLGHAGFILDYSDCGPEGEPKVVYVDAEYKANLRIAVIATDFAHLMSMLSAEREERGKLE